MPLKDFAHLVRRDCFAGQRLGSAPFGRVCLREEEGQQQVFPERSDVRTGLQPPQEHAR